MRNLSAKSATPSTRRGELCPMIGYTDVRVDRKSVLGNPYYLDKEENREIVIEAYRKYLWSALQDAEHLNKYNIASIDSNNSLPLACGWSCPTVGTIYDEIKRLTKLQEDIRLLCWCDGKPCHADVIKKCIIWARKEDYFGRF